MQMFLFFILRHHLLLPKVERERQLQNHVRKPFFTPASVGRRELLILMPDALICRLLIVSWGLVVELEGPVLPFLFPRTG